jgi:hypothetical protein
VDIQFKAVILLKGWIRNCKETIFSTGEAGVRKTFLELPAGKMRIPPEFFWTQPLPKNPLARESVEWRNINLKLLQVKYQNHRFAIRSF